MIGPSEVSVVGGSMLEMLKAWRSNSRKYSQKYCKRKKTEKNLALAKVQWPGKPLKSNPATVCSVWIENTLKAGEMFCKSESAKSVCFKPISSFQFLLMEDLPKNRLQDGQAGNLKSLWAFKLISFQESKSFGIFRFSSYLYVLVIFTMIKIVK